MYLPRILVIDGQALFRSLLAGFLGQQKKYSVVGVASGSCQGLHLCDAQRPDVVLMETDLPRIGGVELARLLLKEHPTLHLIAVTNRKDAATVSQVIEANFSGYVEKDQSPEVLIEAIDRVLAGKKYFTPLFRETASGLSRDPISFSKILSKREQEVLGLVSKGLTSRLIGEELKLSSRTIETHRHNIMKKMGFHDMASFVRFAVDKGFTYAECDHGISCSCHASDSTPAPA